MISEEERVNAPPVLALIRIRRPKSTLKVLLTLRVRKGAALNNRQSISDKAQKQRV
jgi:hypothetical protein